MEQKRPYCPPTCEEQLLLQPAGMLCGSLTDGGNESIGIEDWN